MKKIVLTQEKIINVINWSFMNKQKDYDEPHINLTDFENNLDIQVLSQSDDKLVLLIDHIDPPIANALRRIMIADIPTMAIHRVIVNQNTSVIPDEVLAHRLGLIPILANPKLFQNKKEQDEYNERNSITFELHVRCQRKAQYKDFKLDAVIDNPDEYYDHATVYASDFKWIPVGNQEETFKIIRPIHPGIMIAKLRENQEIMMTVVCEKGTGKQHAKWSPVASAYYKLMPQITLLKPVVGAQAIKLKALCPAKVFDIEDNHCVVAQPINCTSCRECIRDENGFKNSIEVAKVKDKFIFTIESVGMYKPHEIFTEAVEIMKKKVQQYQNTKH